MKTTVVSVYDSWSRYPIGLLAGNTHQMGVYNECVDVHRPVQGKYCVAAVRLDADASFKLNNKDDQESFDHAWNEILGVIYAGRRGHDRAGKKTRRSVGGGGNGKPCSPSFGDVFTV